MNGELHENAAGCRYSNRRKGHIERVEDIRSECVIIAERDSVDIDGDCAPPAMQEQQHQPKYQPHQYQIISSMSLSKTQAYQTQILMTLKRQQATHALNQQLQRNNQALRGQLGKVTQECDGMRQASEAEIARAEMEVRMAKMGKIAEQERNEELTVQLAQLQLAFGETVAKRQRAEEETKNLKKQLEDTGAQLARQTERLAHSEQKNVRLQEQVRSCSEQIAVSQAQLQELNRDKSSLNRSNTKLQAQMSDLKQQLQQAVARLQLVRSEEKSNALAKLEKQEESTKYELKLQELSRQNAVLKQRTSKLQENCQELEQHKEQTEDALKRVEKTNKKNKETITEQEARIRELEEEGSISAEKCRNLDRSLKAAKREVETLQEALTNAEESKATELAKYKRWESLSRTHHTALLEKEEELQQLKENCSQLKKDLENSQRTGLQLSLQLDKAGKENKYLSEQWQEQQEKRILLEGEKEKAISSIIREKDVLSRANYKLLQLLELKDKTMQSIIEAVQKQSDKIEVAVSLDSDELLSQISRSDRDKLRNGKERVKLLQEWLRGKK